MKRMILSLFLCVAMFFALAACGGGAAPAPSGGEGLSIVATIFPEYDWVQNILGDVPGDVTLLLDSGVDLHSFQPTAADVVQIVSCDLFIYVGGESDAWVDDALAESINPDMVVLDLMDILGAAAVEEELAEGMEPAAEESEAEEKIEYDEHVWLSLKNARLFCSAIAEALTGLDPDHGAEYARNAAAYDEKLAALEAEYAAAVSSASGDTLLFGDRFPFRYLTEDYGLRYYAAFLGCSAETEASFETITFLAGKVDELDLPAVLTIEGSDGRIAQTIAQTAAGDPAILTLDSMQSVTKADADAGASYLTIMEDNLGVIIRALG